MLKNKLELPCAAVIRRRLAERGQQYLERRGIAEILQRGLRTLGVEPIHQQELVAAVDSIEHAHERVIDGHLVAGISKLNAVLGPLARGRAQCPRCGGACRHR